MLAYFHSSNQRQFYVGAGGEVPPPQIQKLADRSDVISEVKKCSKNPLGKLTALPQTPNLWGGAHRSPPRTSARCRPFWPRFYGSQGPTNYRVHNRTNDIFQIQAYMKFIFFSFRRTEKIYSVMKGLIGQYPLQNFWARTAPASNILTTCDVHLVC